MEEVTGSSPVLPTTVMDAGMAELADARDLKSLAPKGHGGSTPPSGTKEKTYGSKYIKT